MLPLGCLKKGGISRRELTILMLFFGTKVEQFALLSLVRLEEFF